MPYVIIVLVYYAGIYALLVLAYCPKTTLFLDSRSLLLSVACHYCVMRFGYHYSTTIIPPSELLPTKTVIVISVYI